MKLELVGHRGYPVAFPENTLIGYDVAAALGARFVELDVQCSRDLEPVLYHDPGTMRLSGVDGTIMDRTFEQITQLSAYHPERFQERFRGTPIPSLRGFANWLASRPRVVAFVEVKPESLQYFGVEPVMERVMQAVAGLPDQCVIISFNHEAVRYAREAHGSRIGWVLPAWNSRTEARARSLSPDYLFADSHYLPRAADKIWRGPWQWAVYVVDRLDHAQRYPNKGIGLVETDDIGGMLCMNRGSE